MEFIVTLEIAEPENQAVRVTADDAIDAGNIAWTWCKEELEVVPDNYSVQTLESAIEDHGDGVKDLPRAN
jgi:hypothetical protein